MPQSIFAAVLLAVITAMLLFRSLRLATAFIGFPVLVLTGVLEVDCLREHSPLEVILFRVGIMVVVGALHPTPENATGIEPAGAAEELDGAPVAAPAAPPVCNRGRKAITAP